MNYDFELDFMMDQAIDNSEQFFNKIFEDFTTFENSDRILDNIKSPVRDEYEKNNDRAEHNVQINYETKYFESEELDNNQIFNIDKNSKHLTSENQIRNNLENNNKNMFRGSICEDQKKILSFETNNIEIASYKKKFNDVFLIVKITKADKDNISKKKIKYKINPSLKNSKRNKYAKDNIFKKIKGIGLNAFNKRIKQFLINCTHFSNDDLKVLTKVNLISQKMVTKVKIKYLQEFIKKSFKELLDEEKVLIENENILKKHLIEKIQKFSEENNELNHLLNMSFLNFYQKDFYDNGLYKQYLIIILKKHHEEPKYIDLIKYYLKNFINIIKQYK